MPARFRISYEDREEYPLDGRDLFFDDEAEARAWCRDDIANRDPEVGAVGLWAIGDTDDYLLDCHTFPAADPAGVEWLHQTSDGQRIGVCNDSGLWTVVLLAPGDLGYAPRVAVNDLGTTTFELPSGALRVVSQLDGEGRMLAETVECPSCGPEGCLAWQEYVHSYRDVDETVRRVDGCDAPYLQVSGYSEEDGEVSVGTVAPEFFCWSCGRGYARPEGFEIDWGS